MQSIDVKHVPMGGNTLPTVHKGNCTLQFNYCLEFYSHTNTSPDSLLALQSILQAEGSSVWEYLMRARSHS